MSGRKKPFTEKQNKVGEQDNVGEKKPSTDRVEKKLEPSEEGYWMEEILENWCTIHPHFWKVGSSMYLETEITKLGFLGWPIDLPKVTGMTMNMTITNCHTILPKGACKPKKKRTKLAPTP